MKKDDTMVFLKNDLFFFIFLHKTTKTQYGDSTNGESDDKPEAKSI